MISPATGMYVSTTSKFGPKQSHKEGCAHYISDMTGLDNIRWTSHIRRHWVKLLYVHHYLMIMLNIVMHVLLLSCIEML